jgi:hypothetical protein
MATSKRAAWVSGAIAILIIAVAVIAAAIGGGVYLFFKHVKTDLVAADAAAIAFERARVRFAGQQPLVEFPGPFEAVVHRDSAAPRRQVAALNILAYDPDAHKLVRTDIPGWVLRLMSVGGRIRLANLDLFGSDNRLTLEDLERHGPGLVLEIQKKDGARVLVWAQ